MSTTNKPSNIAKRNHSKRWISTAWEKWKTVYMKGVLVQHSIESQAQRCMSSSGFVKLIVGVLTWCVLCRIPSINSQRRWYVQGSIVWLFMYGISTLSGCRGNTRPLVKIRTFFASCLFCRRYLPFTSWNARRFKCGGSWLNFHVGCCKWLSKRQSTSSAL